MKTDSKEQKKNTTRRDFHLLLTLTSARRSGDEKDEVRGRLREGRLRVPTASLRLVQMDSDCVIVENYTRRRFVGTHPNLRISEIRRSFRGDSGLKLMLDKLRCLRCKLDIERFGNDNKNDSRCICFFFSFVSHCYVKSSRRSSNTG